MKSSSRAGVLGGVLLVVLAGVYYAWQGKRQNAAGADAGFTCGPTGAPPFRTVQPENVPLRCEDGEQLLWKQGEVTRHACLNLPAAAKGQEGTWPLLVYLHGSLASPMSLYTLGKELFELRNDFQVSGDAAVKGFILLAPEGRAADPWSGTGGTGAGFHWDEWFRDPEQNLDVQAVDHFLDEVVRTGKVDPARIYVFGWSNGAYMSVLYGAWRADRIAAVGQYAGGDPWSRSPCPVAMPAGRQVPLMLLRNLCDDLVPCEATSQWIQTMEGEHWPFAYESLGPLGEAVSPTTACTPAAECGKAVGIAQHIRFPRRDPLEHVLAFFRDHPLPK